MSDASAGLWLGVTGVLASDVQGLGGYNVYTLCSGVTVDAAPPVRRRAQVNRHGMGGESIGEGGSGEGEA